MDDFYHKVCEVSEGSRFHAFQYEDHSFVPLEEYPELRQELRSLVKAILCILSGAGISAELKLSFLPGVDIPTNQKEHHAVIRISIYAKSDNLLSHAQKNQINKFAEAAMANLLRESLPEDLITTLPPKNMNKADSLLVTKSAHDFLSKAGGKDIKRPIEIVVGNSTLDVAGRFKGSASSSPKMTQSDGEVVGRIIDLNLDKTVVIIRDNEKAELKIIFDTNSQFVKLCQTFSCQKNHIFSYEETTNSKNGNKIRELVSFEISDDTTDDLIGNH